MSGLTDYVSRVGKRACLFALAGMFVAMAGAQSAQAETRTLKLYHVHTREKAEIAYKRNGRYLPDGLTKINKLLRDWRTSQPTKMDPRLLDIIWEAYRQAGARDYINVIGGYRAPATNNMLRSRSSGVAKDSQHTRGNAMDFFIPGVKLKTLRDVGLRMQAGGVGYYPKSGSPFVHFDVGNVRHWPRMSRKELVAVFPDGGTVHVPSDGKPLPGYQQALASAKKRRGAASIQIANADDAPSSRGGKTLLASLFGGGADEEEDVAASEAAPAAKPARTAPEARSKPEPEVAVAAVVPTRKPTLLEAGVPVPDRTLPAERTAPVPPAEIVAETQVAALESPRVPVPRPAPGREAAPAVASPPAVPADAASTLVAELEAQQDTMAAPSQMAYAVPTPRTRPPFAAVLKGDETAAGANDTAVAAKPDQAEAPMADERSLLAAVAATSDKPGVAEAASTKPAAADKAAPIVVAALQPAPARQPVQAREIPVPAGKTGRFVARVPAPKLKPTIVAPDEAIASRIELAALVTDPDRRALEATWSKPNAELLVREVPTAVFTAGFTPGPVTEAPNRFLGSAVRFLPVAKFR